MESAARDDALKHARHCRPCRLRLAAEQDLNEALAAAAAAEVECAPPSVKLAVQKAVAEQAAFAAASNQSAGNIDSVAARSRRFVRAAAAALLILFAAAAYYMFRSGNGSTQTPTTSEVAPPQSDAGDPVKPAELPPRRGPGMEAERTPERRASGMRRKERLAVRLASSRGDNHASEPDAMESGAMTDYIPLTYLDRATAIESGQVMRVRVPLSTFISLGVPINAQRAGELVNAEVVVGDDGVQRAIRLIR